MARSLFGPEASLEQLADHIWKYRFISPGCGVTEVQQHSIRQMCHARGWKVPLHFDLSTMSSPATLLHWRSLSAIARCLSVDTSARLREAYNPKPASTPGRVIPESHPEIEEESAGDDLTFMQVLSVYDTHFHLDRTRKALQLTDRSSIAEVMAAVPVQRNHYLSLVGCVVSYCDPWTFPQGRELEDLIGEGAQVVVGAHPKHLVGRRPIKRIKELLRLSGVIGVGEVGLDHSVNNPDDWYYQEKILRDILRECLEPDHFLVIHCRGMMTDPTGLQTYMRCLDILKEFAHRNQRIHLHCFTGPREVIDAWMEVFPKTHFG